MASSSSMASSLSVAASLSASSLKNICLACGEQAVRKDRRVIGGISGESGAVTLLWKEFIVKELEKRGEQVNIESVFESYMCRKCYYAYQKLLKAKEVKTFSNIISS